MMNPTAPDGASCAAVCKMRVLQIEWTSFILFDIKNCLAQRGVGETPQATPSVVGRIVYIKNVSSFIN
jgi:hypothetical protein